MAKTWTIKTGRKTPTGDPETLTVKALKADVEQLTRAIKDMIATAQHKRELRGTIGDQHSESTGGYHIYTPFSFNTIADPAGYQRDVDLFFHSLQAWTPEPGTAPQYRTITAEQIPGIIAQAAAIFNKHMPVEDLRTTPEQQAQEQAERAATRARNEAAAAERTRQQEAEAAAIRHAEEFKFLTPMTATPGKSAHAAGAANLKTELTRTFPGVAFKVVSSSFSMGDDIRASWTDGPTGEAVRPIINRYQEGSFDGMTDSYTYTHSAFIDRFGGAKYTFGERSESKALIIKAAAELGHDISDAPETATPGDGLYTFISGRYDRDTTQEIYRHARSMDATPSPEAPSPQQAQDDAGTPAPGRYGATMTRNAEKNGIEIKFTSKPDTATLDTLKASGYRWSKFQKLWYAKESSRTTETARKICGHTQTPATEQEPGAAPTAPARRQPLTMTGKSHFNSFTAIQIAGITAELSRNQYDENGYIIMIDTIAKSERMQKWNRCSISTGAAADDVYLNAYAADGRISYFTLDAPAQLLTAPRKSKTDMLDVFTPEQARQLIENKLKKQLRIITEQEHDAERDRIHTEAGYTPPVQQEGTAQAQAPETDPETIQATAAALRAELDSTPEEADDPDAYRPEHCTATTCKDCSIIEAECPGRPARKDDEPTPAQETAPEPCISCGTETTETDENARAICPACYRENEQKKADFEADHAPEPEAAPETTTEAEQDAAHLAAYIATLQQRDTYRPGPTDTRGPIPETTAATLFYISGRYEPGEVLGWTYSTTFNKWRALVIFSDGSRTITDPQETRKSCAPTCKECSADRQAHCMPWKTPAPAIKRFIDCDACGKPIDDDNATDQILCYTCRPVKIAGAATTPEPRQPAAARARQQTPAQISLF